MFLELEWLTVSSFSDRAQSRAIISKWRFWDEGHMTYGVFDFFLLFAVNRTTIDIWDVCYLSTFRSQPNKQSAKDHGFAGDLICCFALSAMRSNEVGGGEECWTVCVYANTVSSEISSYLA